MRVSLLLLAGLALALPAQAQFVAELPAGTATSVDSPFTPSAGLVDCSGEVIGHNNLTSFFRNNVATGVFVGQSIVAPCDGQLDQLAMSVYHQAAQPPAEEGTFDVTMVEGAGGTGAVVAAESFTVARAAGGDTVEPRLLTFTESFSVTGGETYTFFFVQTEGDTQIIASSNVPYPDGELYLTSTGDIADATPFQNPNTGDVFDLTFELSFKAPPVATEAGPAGARVSIGAAVPNPSAGATRVPFTLDADRDVRLVVSDVLGREVAVVADRRYAAGTHAATADVQGLAPGTYVLRLSTEDAVVTRTFSVVR